MMNSIMKCVSTSSPPIYLFTLRKRIIIVGLCAVPDGVGKILESRTGRLKKRYPQ